LWGSRIADELHLMLDKAEIPDLQQHITILASDSFRDLKRAAFQSPAMFEQVVFNQEQSLRIRIVE